MRTRHASSADVAKLAGVSTATVSYVLNNRRDLSITETTRQRVLAAAKEIEYRPNRLVSGVLRGKSNLVAIVSASLGSDFHSRIVGAICQELSGAGYQSFVAQAENDTEAERQVNLMVEHRVDGIIAMTSAWAWLRRSVLPERLKVVVVDSRDYSDIADCVASDDVKGARLAVDHLVGLGHRRIAFWSKVWNGSSYRDRLQGYCDAMAAVGIAPDASLMLEQPESPRRFAIEVSAILKTPDPPSAFFCTNDITAMFVRKAAEEIGLRVPDDVAVVGYSGQSYSTAYDLTTIDQQPEQMGRTAARVMLNRIGNAERPTAVELTPVELVVRSSTVAMARQQWFDPID